MFIILLTCSCSPKEEHLSESKEQSTLLTTDEQNSQESIINMNEEGSKLYKRYVDENLYTSYFDEELDRLFVLSSSSVYVYDFQDLRLICSIDTRVNPRNHNFSISPKWNYLVIPEQGFQLWDINSCNPITTIQLNQYSAEVVFSNDDSMLIYTDENDDEGIIYFYEISKGQVTKEYKTNSAGIKNIKVNPKKDIMAIIPETDINIRLLNLSTMEFRDFPGDGVEFSCDGESVSIWTSGIGYSNSTRLITVDNFDEKGSFIGTSGKLDINNRFIITKSFDPYFLFIYDINSSYTELAEINPPDGYVSDFFLDKFGEKLIVLTTDMAGSKIYSYSLDSLELVSEFDVGEKIINPVLSKDGNYITFFLEDDSLLIYDINLESETKIK